MRSGFFSKKCFFDFNNQQDKLIFCNQELNFFPLINQNHDQIKHTICMAILNFFYPHTIVNHFKSQLIELEKKNQSIDLIFSQVLNFIDISNYKINNLSIHITLQEPKLHQNDLNHKILIRNFLCDFLKLSQDKITVQAGTGERIGDTGKSKATIFIANISFNKKNEKNQSLIGFGYDRHRFSLQDNIEKKPMICGQKIPYHKNIDAHSDGDIVFHAMVNAIFSVIAEGDIGDHFPDTNSEWRNASSIKFLEYAINLLKKKSLQIKSIKIEIITSLRFQNILKKMNFLEKASRDLMRILNIKNDKSCHIKLNLANAKNKNRDERCIKNDLGIDANVRIEFVTK